MKLIGSQTCMLNRGQQRQEIQFKLSSYPLVTAIPAWRGKAQRNKLLMNFYGSQLFIAPKKGFAETLCYNDAVYDNITFRSKNTKR